MTLEDLRIFIAACETHSLSALARDLGRTQSAVSQHVKRLENEFDAHLITRSAAGIEPTAAGEILRELALEGLDALSLAQDRIHALKHGDTPTLTITTGGTTVRHFLKNAVVRFRTLYPDTQIHFLPAGSTRRCFELLRLNQADLALVTTQTPSHGVEIRTLAMQHLFLLTAPGDELAGYDSLSVADLDGMRYLGLAEGTAHRQLIDNTADNHGVRLVPELAFDDFDTASVFVELGLGNAIVPAVQAYNFAQTGRVQTVPIRDLPAVPFGWGARRWKYRSTAAARFVELFDDTLDELRHIPGLDIVAP